MKVVTKRTSRGRNLIEVTNDAGMMFHIVNNGRQSNSLFYARDGFKTVFIERRLTSQRVLLEELKHVHGIGYEAEFDPEYNREDMLISRKLITRTGEIGLTKAQAITKAYTEHKEKLEQEIVALKKAWERAYETAYVE